LINLTLNEQFDNDNNPSFLWFLFVVINMLDFISTAMNVNVYGYSVEMNPIIQPIIQHGGLMGLFWYKIATVGIILVLLRKYITYQMLLALNTILLLIVCGNVFL
jgi:uncharacterized membrane protein